MDKSIKKKLKIVFWAFLVISIPTGFFLYSTLLLDNAYKAYEETILTDDNEKIEFAIKEIIRAESFAFYNKNLVNIKVQLYYRKKEYRKALNSIENKEAFIYKALLYEHLNRSDSASIFYKKAISELKKQLKKNKDAQFAYEIERQIALFYTFLNQSESAKEYLTEIPEDYDPDLRELLLHYDYYIENYNSGGYKDYLEGETLLFGIDSISDTNIDSLFATNRFYYDSYESSGKKHEYKIKKIFEQKAKEAGMNRLD